MHTDCFLVLPEILEQSVAISSCNLNQFADKIGLLRSNQAKKINDTTRISTV